MRNRKRMPRIAEVVRLPVSFHAGKGHVVAVLDLSGSTIGLRFDSTEQLLTFFNRLMEKAVKVWPEDPWIREYLSED